MRPTVASLRCPFVAFPSSDNFTVDFKPHAAILQGPPDDFMSPNHDDSRVMVQPNPANLGSQCRCRYRPDPSFPKYKHPGAGMRSILVVPRVASGPSAPPNSPPQGSPDTPISAAPNENPKIPPSP